MNRKVIFWGCGKIAREIYSKFRDDISLLYAISNDTKETLFVPEEGRAFQVKRPENKVSEVDGVIIICSADYERIAEQLSLLGYKPFADFMDYELAEVLWTGKKIALLYGFCHLRGIADCLRGSEAFSQTYMAIYYPNYLFLNHYRQERLQYLLAHCDVFIYGMALSQENHRKNKAILDGLNRDVKILCLHAAYFGGYFPQKERAYNDMNAYAVKCEGYDYTPFSYGDSWLNDCIAGGMGLDDIFERMEKGAVYEKDFILRYAEKEWKRLRYQERESDFKIADYLEKNFRVRRLFRNETHMENSVLLQYALQVLQYLGYPDRPEITDRPLLNCSQHFIYPGVAQVLGLGWDVWEEELDLYTYAGWKKVSPKTYIQEYYESCSQIWQLKKKHLLP